MLINKLLQTAALCVLLLFSASSIAMGQIIHGQPTAGSINMEYSAWKIEGDDGSIDVNQFALPISGFVPLRDNLEMRFSVANTSNTFDDGSTDYSLSGLSDLRLQINQSLAEDRFLLSVGFNLPTGKKELTLDEEFMVLQVLSVNYLEFPIRHLGEGIGLNFMAGGAAEAGEWRLGLALAYKLNGAYDPYEDYEEYDPGDQFSVIAGADLQKDKHSLSVQAVYTAYTDDQVDGSNIFAQGDQADFRLTHRLNQESFVVETVAGILVRGNNTRYDSTETIIEQLKLYGNEFYFFGGVTMAAAGQWTFTPSLQLRVIGEDDRDIGGSNLFGLGGTVGHKLGEKSSFTGGLTYYTGSAEGGDLDISGLRISAGISSTF